MPRDLGSAQQRSVSCAPGGSPARDRYLGVSRRGVPRHFVVMQRRAVTPEMRARGVNGAVMGERAMSGGVSDALQRGGVELCPACLWGPWARHRRWLRLECAVGG